MYGAYQKWCRTTSTRAQYFEKVLEMCDMVNDTDYPKAGKHRDLEKANIQKSEEAVQQTISAIQCFTNPFKIPGAANPEDDRLYTLHSGAAVPLAVELDVMHAEQLGQQKKLQFINERLKDRTRSFFDPIPRNKLLTMELANKKVVLSTSKGKVNIVIFKIDMFIFHALITIKQKCTKYKS